MATDVHALAPPHLPSFVTAPGESDFLMSLLTFGLVAGALGAGVAYLTLHSLPERMAHRGRAIQFELVAALGLLALFTHETLFWVAALVLALVKVPDVSSPVGRIADALERIAGMRAGRTPEPPAKAAAEDGEAAR